MMFCKTIYNVMRKTICENRRIFHTLQDLSKFNSKQCNLYLNTSYFQQNLNPIRNKRFKKTTPTSKHRYDSEDEKDSEDVDVDDYLLTNSSKIIKAIVPSLRLDAFAKTGFGLSRAKIDKIFYQSNIRVNGEKIYKKSVMVQIDDEIDLTIGRSPDNPKFLIVHRCKLLSVSAESNVITVKFIRNKSLLIEDYND